MAYSKQIVYLSDAQYQELVTEGSIIVSGQAITYNANNIYVTPQTDPAELIAEKYENLTFPVAKGTHCVYNGGYYEANQTISTSESWTAAHWVALTNVGAEAASLKSEINGKYTKPQTGIPASDLASGVIPSVPVQDVQSEGVSILNNGIAEINPVVSVSGTTPSITGVANTRYICGECSTLSITAPASGCIDVVFESGSTPTVLTVTSVSGEIVWANDFDPESLESGKTYELNILDGKYGVAGVWETPVQLL